MSAELVKLSVHPAQCWSGREGKIFCVLFLRDF